MLVGDFHALFLLIGILSLPLAAIFGRKRVGDSSGTAPQRPYYYFHFFWVAVAGFALSLLAALTIFNVFYDTYMDEPYERPFNDVDLASRFILISLVFFLFTWLGGLVADVAHRKGRNWVAFFWLSLLLSPLVTWLIVATFGPETREEEAAKSISKSLESKLEELKGLHEKGLVSQAEFEEKKRKLLNQM